jgi:hypothetical protein
MTEACRLDPKPPGWDYFNDGNRRNLYKVFQALIKLREYNAFHTQNYNYSLNTYVKRFTILDSTMNVNIIGNFNVVQSNINPQFPNTGWWYDYFSGDSILIINTQEQIPLEPGEFHIYTTIKVPTPEPGILLDVEKADDTEIITEYRLEQNYPNPFNPSTKIRFTIPSNVKRETSNVTLKVYDVLGNEVATLVNDELSAGEYEVEFNSLSSIWNPASGIYFYQLKAENYIETKKMLVLK